MKQNYPTEDDKLLSLYSIEKKLLWIIYNHAEEILLSEDFNLSRKERELVLSESINSLKDSFDLLSEVEELIIKFKKPKMTET